jgi:hypothetical protein
MEFYRILQKTTTHRTLKTNRPVRAALRWGFRGFRTDEITPETPVLKLPETPGQLSAATGHFLGFGRLHVAGSDAQDPVDDLRRYEADGEGKDDDDPGLGEAERVRYVIGDDGKKRLRAWPQAQNDASGFGLAALLPLTYAGLRRNT